MKTLAKFIVAALLFAVACNVEYATTLDQVTIADYALTIAAVPFLIIAVMFIEQNTYNPTKK